jgi:hypothetical protein
MAPGFAQARLDELEDVSSMNSVDQAFMNKLESQYTGKKVACNLFIEFHS